MPLAIGRLPLTKTDVALAVFVPAVSDLAIAALAVLARALAAVELAVQLTNTYVRTYVKSFSRQEGNKELAFALAPALALVDVEQHTATEAANGF